MRKEYNKLVRDNIPEIIQKDGKKASFRTLTSDEEYKKALEDKLLEECQEVISASGKDRLVEMADLFEVVKALFKLENDNLEYIDIINLATRKGILRGNFDKRLFLEYTEDDK